MYLTRTGRIATPTTKIGNPMRCTAHLGFDVFVVLQGKIAGIRTFYIPSGACEGTERRLGRSGKGLLVQVGFDQLAMSPRKTLDNLFA